MAREWCVTEILQLGTALSMTDERSDQYIDKSVLYYRLIENCTRVISMGIKGGTILGCAAFAYWSIEALAGQQTDAQIAILIGFLSEPKGSGPTVAVSLAAGLLGVLYGYLQWRLKRRVIRSFDAYRQAVEGPDRSSSMLDSYGQTHPRDR
jgi:hypothetical protein